MNSQILRAILLAAASAAVAFPLGYFYQAWAGWSLFCVGLAVQMGFHFRNFARLDRWSKQPVVDATLEGEGAWDGIFGRLTATKRICVHKLLPVMKKSRC